MSVISTDIWAWLQLQSFQTTAQNKTKHTHKNNKTMQTVMKIQHCKKKKVQTELLEGLTFRTALELLLKILYRGLQIFWY